MGRRKDYHIIISENPILDKSDAIILPVERINLVPEQARGNPDRLIAYGDPVFLKRAFLMGVYDYLKEPWTPEELMFRLRRLLDSWDRSFDLGQLSYRGNHLRSSTGEIRLSANESLILRVLLKQRGKIVSREVLFYTLWGRPPKQGSRVIDVHISSIKRKIRSLASEMELKKLISSVRGVGYMIP